MNFRWSVSKLKDLEVCALIDIGVRYDVASMPAPLAASLQQSVLDICNEFFDNGGCPVTSATFNGTPIAASSSSQTNVTNTSAASSK